MRTLLAFVAGASALVALSAFASNHGLSARGDAGRDSSSPITVTGGTTHQVGISGFTYTPNTLTIAPGDSVSFTASSFHPLRTDDDIFRAMRIARRRSTPSANSVFTATITADPAERACRASSSCSRTRSSRTASTASRDKALA